MKVNYADFQGFEHIYLEDSFIHKIYEHKDQLIFDGDFVLTSKHPLYRLPDLGIYHCYCLGRILFNSVLNSIWLRKSAWIQDYVDREIDLGNIDNLDFVDGYYLISGEWGEIQVQSTQPFIVLNC